jgi:flagellar biosynthetic protein FlhB
MAEERDETEHTEDPTPRRLDEAVRRGDVVKSIEVSSWFLIAGGTLILMAFAGSMANSLQATLRGVLAHSYEIPADGPGLAELAKALAMDVLSAIGIPLFLLTLAAFAGNAVQHRILFSFDPVMPNLSRI